MASYYLGRDPRILNYSSIMAIYRKIWCSLTTQPTGILCVREELGVSTKKNLVTSNFFKHDALGNPSSL